MLDKNYDQILDNGLQEILNKFSNKNPNIILCSESFTKSYFLNELINSVDFPVIFLDFDLLYTGYVVSNMIPKNDRVRIYQPEKNNLKDVFLQIAKQISEEKYLIILDSLNGFYNLFSEIESGIFINAITMLFASVARQKNSVVVISAIVRKKENEGWVLLPGGRHIVESKNLGMYYLKNDEKSLKLMILNSINKWELAGKNNH